MATVLWIGDAGSHTGFGRVTREIAGGLAERGHDVSVLGLNYSGDYDPELLGLKVYRANLYGADDVFGAKRVKEMVERVKPEVTVLLHDPAAVWQYIFGNPFDQEQSLMRNPVLAYCPVDGYDYPRDWTDILPRAVNFVAMSRFGQQAFRPSGIVRHGINPDEFWPIDEEHPLYLADGGEITSKREAKIALGMDPARFLILRVDTNSGRKDYAATIKAVAPILEKNRDVGLHLHAATDPKMPGVNIPYLLNRYDLLEGQVTSSTLPNSTTGWSQEKLLTLYNAADLFVSTSRGEGFGLTLAEALACGVPVVAQRCSAIPETVGPGGVLIEPKGRITVPAGQDLCLPNIPTFTETIEQLIEQEQWRIDLGAAGRKHVTESFSWTEAVDRFHDFIEAAASRWRQSQEASPDGPE